MSASTPHASQLRWPDLISQRPVQPLLQIRNLLERTAMTHSGVTFETDPGAGEGGAGGQEREREFGEEVDGGLAV